MAKGCTVFDNYFTLSSRFLVLPATSKLLYFYLLKDADDDGIVDGYATVRILGVEITDWTNLVEKGFIVLLKEPFLGFIPDYLTHNRNLDIRYKKDSPYLSLLAEKFPQAQIQVKVKDEKNKTHKKIVPVAAYLRYKQEMVTPEPLLMSSPEPPAAAHEFPPLTKPNLTKPNLTKPNPTKPKRTQLKQPNQTARQKRPQAAGQAAAPKDSALADACSQFTEAESLVTREDLEKAGLPAHKLHDLLDAVAHFQIKKWELEQYLLKVQKDSSIKNPQKWLSAAIMNHYL